MTDDDSQTYHLEITLTQRQRDLLVGTVAEQVDWHHSEARPEIAQVYRTLMKKLQARLEKVDEDV